MTAWRHARGASLTAFALAAAACAGGATPASVGSPAERSEPVDLGPVARALPPAGPIVATVEGEAITLEEVRATAAATRLSPLAALRRLEEERVLYRHAVALGTLDGPEVEHETRRAAVQVLLRRRVEEAVGPESVTHADLMARYEATRTAFVQPERRGSAHVLAELPPSADESMRAAAEQFVTEVLRALALETDPSTAADRYRTEDPSVRGFRVVVEHLPPASRQSQFEEPYLAALFSSASPGVIGAPVHSSRGVHAIVVTSIEPGFRVPLSDAEPILRHDVLVERRAAALDALGREIAGRTQVLVDERVAANALSGDLFADDRALRSAGP